MPERVHTVVVEEHHEAFYAWRYARAQGWIPAAPTTLLHVDEHQDMALPNLRHALPASGAPLAEIARFTYGELGINTFLWAAVCDGFFDRVQWLRVRHDALAGGWRRIGIRPKTPAGLTFATATAEGFSPLPPGQLAAIEYAPITVSDALSFGQQCILDIDLDYFCWNEYPELGPCTMDVPEETFREFVNDPYHFLRLSMNSKVAAVRSADGQFQLAFQHVARPTPAVTPRPIVAQRIDQFVEFLRRWRVRPLLVDICRSKHSGWVQSANAAFVESRLLAQLTELFPIEQHSVGELLAGHFCDEDIFLSVPRRIHAHA